MKTERIKHRNRRIVKTRNREGIETKYIIQKGGVKGGENEAERREGRVKGSGKDVFEPPREMGY